MDEAIVKIIRKIAFARTSDSVPVQTEGRSAVPVAGVCTDTRVFAHPGRLLVLPTVMMPMMTWHPAAADEIFGSQPLSDTDYKITMPGAAPAFNWQTEPAQATGGVISETRSEVSFKLSFDPDIAPAETAVGDSNGAWRGGLSMERIDFIPADEIKMQDISEGFAYSARVDIERTTGVLDESQIVSSRQLGVHYGRLGSVNYSGVDLGYRQFNDTDQSYDSGDKDLWSLGVTTGRRFSLTGLDESDPLWTVSLRGQFSLIENSDDKVKLDNHLWYLSPGLYWQHDSFELSADVLMPFMHSGEAEEETDYRIRAKIQKRF
jgi:hypothetical protein